MPTFSLLIAPPRFPLRLRSRSERSPTIRFTISDLGFTIASPGRLSTAMRGERPIVNRKSEIVNRIHSLGGGLEPRWIVSAGALDQ